MNLQLARQEAFNGVTCDFYRNEGGSEKPEIYMTREQIGRALGYSSPSDAIRKIHDRNKDRLSKYSVADKLSGTDGKAYDTYIYSPKGVYEICRWSRQPKADAFMDWVWEVVERLRTGGAGAATDMAAIIAETVKITITEFSKQILPLFKEALTRATENPHPALSATFPQGKAGTAGFTCSKEADSAYNVCKLETFPAQLREQVDALIDEMLIEQQLNFSRIARFCTLNGHTISSPAVKRYFDKSRGDRKRK